MIDPTEATRAEVLERFHVFAAHLFDDQPDARSIVLGVAQFWNDSADDEVHGWVTVSARDQPVWPHECHEPDDDDDDDDPSAALRPAVPGESCYECTGDYARYYFSFYGGYGDAMVEAFEAFCPEGAHQGMSNGQGYAPFAIARRTRTGVALEQVGLPRRPPAVIGAPSRTDVPWGDPRALALLHEVGRAPGDDAPRAVLSDYLLEAHPDEPLGEALALCLAPQLDDAARARRDELIAAHRARWLHPLGHVIARGCVELDRGLPRAADVYADAAARAAVAGAPAWATLETIRIAPGSLDVVDPAMRAVRDLGPLGLDGVRAIAGAPQPWPIERLHVRYDHQLDPALTSATTLPRLRELVLSIPSDAELGRLAAAPWWPDLERLTLLIPSFDGGAALARLRPLLPPGKQLAIAELGSDGHPAGWCVVFDDHQRDQVELSMVGWHADATFGQLRALIGALPPGLELVLARSRYRSWLTEDIALLQHSDRVIRIA